MQDAVIALVFADDQIAKTVISRIAVNVMDDGSVGKRVAKNPLRDGDMFTLVNKLLAHRPHLCTQR